MEKSSKNRIPAWAWLIILPIWTYGTFLVVQILLGLFIGVLIQLGVPLLNINQVVLVTLISVVAYGLAIALVIWLPYKLFKAKTTKKELGVPDSPVWMDAALSIPAYILYTITTSFVMLIVMRIFTGIDTAQPQELPFSQTMLVSRWQYILAFTVMVIMAPVAEELLFRGYLYGKLRAVSSAVVSILVASLAFGLAHLWAGGDGPLQWMVAVDTFTLSIFLCLLREYTGAIWAGIFVHMIKNGIAFYLLFVNPGIIDQLKAAVLPLL